MANTPPSRSYRAFSATFGLAWACALSGPASTAPDAAVRASPAATLRLVRDVETTCVTGVSLIEIDRVRSSTSGIEPLRGPRPNAFRTQATIGPSPWPLVRSERRSSNGCHGVVQFAYYLKLT